MAHRLLLLVFLVAAGTLAVHSQSATGGSGPPPPPPAGAPPRPPMDGTGAISGVVSDGDTHRPIAGAVVYLGIQGRGPVGRMSRQVTDAKGRFVFLDLPASDAFFMNVSKAGYSDGHYGDVGPISAGVASGLIRLTAGEWFSHADIPIWRPGVITGAVVDERGEPVVGVRVRVLSRIFVAGLPHIAAGPAAMTDDRGRYRIAGLPAGAYYVSVPSVQNAVPASLSPLEIEGLTPDSAARGNDNPRRNNGAIELDPTHLLIVGNYPTPPPLNGRPQTYPMAFFPGAAAIADATPIDLRQSERRDGVDIVMRPVATVQVSGRLDASRSVASGLVLRLIASGLDDLGEGSEVATTIAEADGSFTFLSVPSGQYTLDATRSRLEYSYGPPRAMATQEMPVTPGQMPGPGNFLGGIPAGPPGTRASGTHTAGDLSMWGRVPLSVGSTDIVGLSVAMRPTVTMRGRFAFEGNGDPPGHTVVFAEPADGRASLGLQGSSTRPVDGAEDQFVISGLMPGEYTFRIVGLHPTRYAVKSITSGNADYTTRAFDTSGGQEISDVVITYTDRVATINGHVQPDPANPTLISVIAFPQGREQWTKYGLTPTRLKAVPVTSAGTFVFENIPAGAYFLVAVDSAQARRWQEPTFLDTASKQAARLTIGWGETKAQDLRVSVIK